MQKEEVKRYGRRWWMEVGGVLTICWFLREGVRWDAKGCDLNYYFRGIDQLCLVYCAENIWARAIGCLNSSVSCSSGK